MPWKEITEQRYTEALEILPPALLLAKGFLMGEASSHRRCKVTKRVAPTFSAFVFASGRYYEGDPMTFAEFRAFKVEDSPLPP